MFSSICLKLPRLFQTEKINLKLQNIKIMLFFILRTVKCIIEEDMLDIEDYMHTNFESNSKMLLTGINNDELKSGPLHITENSYSLKEKTDNFKAKSDLPKISAKIDEISAVLDDQLNDFSSEIKKKIASSIESKKIDHSRYRDIFVVKKRTFDQGNQKVIQYDVDEKIIPKFPNIVYEMNTDKYTKFVLGGIFVLLFALVFTTTLKLYENLIKFKIFEKQTIKTEKN